jgi:hypothetical protein
VRRTILLTLVLCGLYWLVAARGPRAVGLWQDDAIYLCTAQSLAAGTGYRHIEIPGTPLQTQYPILYPALLALGFLVDGNYPHNLGWLLLPSALAAAGLVTLSIRYGRDVLDADRRLLIVVGLLAALSPVLFSFVRFAMSDLPYGVLALAAVYIVDHKYAGAKTAATQRWWLVSAAALVALSVLTRSIGVTLAVALLAVLLWRRQVRHAGLAGLVLAVFLVPWSIRQVWAARANGPLQDAFLIVPNLGYAMWLPHSAADTGRVIVQNFLRTALGLSYFQMALPQGWIQRTLAAGSWHTLPLHLASYLAMGLIGVGFVRSLFARGAHHRLPESRSAQPCRPMRVRLLPVYAVIYAAMMLVWPFEPYRFLIPWTPLLLYFLLRGVHDATRVVRRTRAAGIVPVTLVAIALAVCFVADDARIVTSTERKYFLREFPIDWSEVRAVEQWVARNTQREDILAAADAAGLYLATGRQGYYFWPDTDPYRLFYGPDRSWTTFYALGSASESRYLLGELRRIPEVYQAADIRYYIEHRQIDVGEGAMAQCVREHPALFTPVFTTSGRNFTVYRVHALP